MMGFDYYKEGLAQDFVSVAMGPETGVALRPSFSSQEFSEVVGTGLY